MKILAAIIGFALYASALFADDQEPLVKPAETFTTVRQSVTQKGKKFTGYFFDHAKYKAMRGPVKFLDAAALPPVSIPFDYAKTLSFPMYGNDQVGDCFEASIAHHEGTLTGNNGTEKIFVLKDILAQYRKYSGGDNGLSDGDVQTIWTGPGICNDPAAKIVDWLYVDTTDAKAIESAMWHFGGCQFTFAVPNSWMNHSDDGDVWDSVDYQNNNNGHAVHWNGVRANGDRALQTWGVRVWITQKAVRVCDPSGFVVFSVNWFNTKGYAPNGKHVTELAAIWRAAGGKTIPASVIGQFPPVDPVPPIPPIPPIPPGPGPITGTTIIVNKAIPAGEYRVVPKNTETFPQGTAAAITEQANKLKAMVDAMNQPSMPDTATPKDKEPAKTPKQSKAEWWSEQLANFRLPENWTEQQRLDWWKAHAAGYDRNQQKAVTVSSLLAEIQRLIARLESYEKENRKIEKQIADLSMQP